jgi:DNA-binding protein
MLMEDTNQQYGQKHIVKSNIDYTVINIDSAPIMESVFDVLTVLQNTDHVILKSNGNSIPNAVAVANIITEDVLKDKSKVQKILLDTLSAAGIGKMTSTIEILLEKVQ